MGNTRRHLLGGCSRRHGEPGANFRPFDFEGELTVSRTVRLDCRLDNAVGAGCAAPDVRCAFSSCVVKGLIVFFLQENENGARAVHRLDWHLRLAGSVYILLAALHYQST